MAAASVSITSVVASASSGSVAVSSTGKNIRDTYRSHTHEEHIYEVPDTYIGSAEKDTVPILVLAEDGSRISQRDGEIVPGLYKVFDEVLVNALDQYTRLSTQVPPPEHIVKQIHVGANKETGALTVWNDGMGIDVVEHPDQKVFVPEMIFGKLLTSTNYDKEEKRFTGGKNGYGSKLANIFSKEFTVTTIDCVRGKKYTQTWKDNMKTVGKPKITSCKTKPFTEITWIPDYARFGLAGLTEDMYQLIRRRTLDCAAWCGAAVRVKWNDDVIPCRNILQYTKLLAGDSPIVQLKGNEHWEVLVGMTEPGEGFRQVSFVNGIHTSNGGRHVDYVVKKIVDGIVEMMKKKIKRDIRASTIKDNLLVVVKAMIVNPSFKSQTKDELTTPVAQMGTRWNLEDDGKDIAAILSKTGLQERLMESQAAIDDKAAKKTDGAKRRTITGIPKLEDAMLSGTSRSAECTLILTEGDSAASTAISGLKVVGRELYGVYPLRGKMINAKNSSTSSLHANPEIQNIKKIIGLEAGKKYTNVSSLRYGKVMIMTDQDHDGSHIKGLVMNMFHAQWPELLPLGFIVSMLTPIVKVFHGRTKKELSFYTLYDYEQWREHEPTSTSSVWRVKYYKGLGTSTDMEAREYFKHLRGIHYEWDEGADGQMDKAFLKGMEDTRKDWISSYDPANTLKLSTASSGTFMKVPVSDFINKELIAYSHSSNIRAIPNVMDGFKVSQRKILFGCLKRNLTTEIRVAQLGGYVSEHAAYHHGEASLYQTITAMAQTFVGSNNINLLEPVGQFGTRLMGGEDAASPRYIHTHLTKIARAIFLGEDTPILNYTDDDGLPVEPEWYAPVIPMILVNGCRGIGTGYSTFVPSYEPRQIAKAIRSRLLTSSGAGAGAEDGSGGEVGVGLPWWRGFTGEISVGLDTEGRKVIVNGRARVEGDSVVVIEELPVGTWTKNYREFLETLLNGSPLAKKPMLREIRDEYNNVDVKITLEFLPGVLPDLVSSGKLYKELKLESAVHLTNMWLYDASGKLRRYETPEAILEDFMRTRLGVYEARREHQLRELEKEHRLITAKAEFIQAVCEERLDLRGEDDAVAGALRGLGLPELSRGGGESVDVGGGADEGESGDPLAGWKYLLSMPVRSLTEAKRRQLLEEREGVMRKMEELRGSTPISLWIRDLDAFDVAYDTFLRERAAADTEHREDDSSAKPKAVVRRALKNPRRVVKRDD